MRYTAPKLVKFSKSFFPKSVTNKKTNDRTIQYRETAQLCWAVWKFTETANTGEISTGKNNGIFVIDGVDNDDLEETSKLTKNMGYKTIEHTGEKPYFCREWKSF